MALEAHKVSVAAADLEKISLKAAILNEVYGRTGDPKKLVRALRLRFSHAATMGDYDGSLQNLAKETDCIGKIILPRQEVPSLTRCDVPSLLGVEGALGSGDAAPGLSPAKTPRLDLSLFNKHPHPMLAGDRTAGDLP